MTHHFNQVNIVRNDHRPLLVVVVVVNIYKIPSLSCSNIIHSTTPHVLIYSLLYPPICDLVSPTWKIIFIQKLTVTQLVSYFVFCRSQSFMVILTTVHCGFCIIPNDYGHHFSFLFNNHLTFSNHLSRGRQRCLLTSHILTIILLKITIVCMCAA